MTATQSQPPQAVMRVDAAPPAALRPHATWTPYAFVLPAIVILAAFVLAAMVQVVIFSFTRYTAFSGPDFVGFQNYGRVLGGERFWFCLGNSFVYLLVTPAVMFVSLVAAMTIHSALRGMSFVRLMLFLPVVTPTIVAAVAFRIVLDGDEGLLNRFLTPILTTLGLDPVYWLSEYPFTLVSAMFVTLWKGFGYYMMIFLAGLVAVPRELEEAANIDGAGRFGVFRHVTLPALRPILILVALISSISALKVFDELYVTVAGAPITDQTAVPLLFNVMIEEGDYGYASAIGVALFVVILAFSLVQLYLSRERA